MNTMTASKIEWTDRSDWNVIRGCTRESEGCRNCYAERIAARFSDPGQPFHEIAECTKSGPRWTGKLRLVENRLDLPLRWRKPARIFVNSMFDLFAEGVPDAWIDRVFAVMALCPQHTFQVLTKRAERMREYIAGFGRYHWLPPRLIEAANAVAAHADRRARGVQLLLRSGRRPRRPRRRIRSPCREEGRRAPPRRPRVVGVPGMTERRVWIAQCLCGPNRHAIVALAGDFDSEAAAGELLPKLRDAVTDLRRSVNPWCAICGSPEEDWRYEIGRTRFKTIAEALPELTVTADENALANAIFGSHGPARPSRN